MKFKSIKIAAIITTALGITAVSIFNAPKSTHAESLEESLDNTNKLIDELREMAAKQDIESEDMAIAMAVYMLGFGSYKGF